MFGIARVASQIVPGSQWMEDMRLSLAGYGRFPPRSNFFQKGNGFYMGGMWEHIQGMDFP